MATPGVQDGLSAYAQFSSPHGLGYDKVNQILVVADTGNNMIRLIDMRTGEDLCVIVFFMSESIIYQCKRFIGDGISFLISFYAL